MVSNPLLKFLHQPLGFLELLGYTDHTPLEICHALRQGQALVLLSAEPLQDHLRTLYRRRRRANDA
jgi:hypothetical protein